MASYVHPSATVEAGASLGADVSIWHGATIRSLATIGDRTSVGGGAYIGEGVHVGENCKIQNHAQVFEGANVSNGVFVGPGVILANDRYPRAINPGGSRKTGMDWHLLGVTVEEGASLGAGTIVNSGVKVGRWSLVGAGAVVTHDVPGFGLVLGVPARTIGWVCRCATRLYPPFHCPNCGYSYELGGDGLVELATRSEL